MAGTIDEVSRSRLSEPLLAATFQLEVSSEYQFLSVVILFYFTFNDSIFKIDRFQSYWLEMI